MPWDLHSGALQPARFDFEYSEHTRQLSGNIQHVLNWPCCIIGHKEYAFRSNCTVGRASFTYTRYIDWPLTKTD